MVEMISLTDEEYHAIPNFGETEADTVVSASFLKEIFKRGLFECKHNPFKVDEKLKKLFSLGTLIHLYILENTEFTKKYYLGEYDPLETREKVSDTETKLLTRLGEEVNKKFPFMWEEEENEISFIGEIEGVSIKCKIDKIIVEDGKIKIYDIKSTGLGMGSIKRDRFGKPYEIIKTMDEYGYALQLAFYKLVAKKYYEKEGEHLVAECYILFLSKNDKIARMIRISEDMMEQAEERMNELLREIKAYIYTGYINKELLV